MTYNRFLCIKSFDYFTTFSFISRFSSAQKWFIYVHPWDRITVIPIVSGKLQNGCIKFIFIYLLYTTKWVITTTIRCLLLEPFTFSCVKYAPNIGLFWIFILRNFVINFCQDAFTTAENLTTWAANLIVFLAAENLVL